MAQMKFRSNNLQAATSIRRGVTQLARALRRLRAAHGLSAAKLALLGHLYRSDRPMTANDLARLESLQPQSLTRLIAELEQDGLIIRRRADGDRRQIDISITQTGQALLVADARRQDAWLARVMSERLSESEIEILLQAGHLLTRLTEHAAPAPANDLAR
jgi:DNA-binding MarR family transcriptional regulator